MGGWSSTPARLRQLEKQLAPSGVTVVVEGPRTTEEERRLNDASLLEAERQGRPAVRVVIRIDRAPPVGVARERGY